MSKNLVIVESPTKAKTIKKFLGKDFQVESSFGHIRDLPVKKMGVDVKKDFEPTYEIPEKAKKTLTVLKKAAQKSAAIYFATDEDREGEAIAWHLLQALGLEKSKGKAQNSKLKDIEIHRIVFHEITEKAIKEALEHPRELDQKLVDAQQARRILDRLVGYELSPFLWRKVTRGLSAGRVQSVAVRLIVEREDEINKFKPEEYWQILSTVKSKTSPDHPFEARIYAVGGERADKLYIKNKAQAEKIVADIKAAKLQVAKVNEKETSRSPQPPFTTSTLQQDANRKLGFSAKQTMRLAQQLYEGVALGAEGHTGLITYMRTDSLNLAGDFLKQAHGFIKEKYGDIYSLKEPKVYKTKSKGAQEAHEAIRPTSAERSPESVKEFLDARQYKLYDLIWRRALASQMPGAKLNSLAVDVAAGPHTLRANGQTIKFDGFLKLYPESQKETLLPELKAEEPLDLEKIDSSQKFTEPPARYNEASLVKKLEELGIGRPSTYAPTISTIQDRGYVEKIERNLKPTDIAGVVNKLLVEHFPKIVDFEFTAKMEDDLDEIARGKANWRPILKEFYNPFKKNLMEKDKTITKDDTVNEKTDEKCDKCGEPLIIKTGRFGRFLACTGYPKCKNAKPLPGEEDKKPEIKESDEKCDKCGKPMQIKHSRYGEFLGCSGYPECKNIKSIEKSTGVKCPDCGNGEILERKSRKGKIFFSCNKWPKCEYALWNRPTGEACSVCKSLMVEAGKDKVKCSSKECPNAKTQKTEKEEEKEE